MAVYWSGPISLRENAPSILISSFVYCSAGQPSFYFSFPKSCIWLKCALLATTVVCFVILSSFVCLFVCLFIYLFVVGVIIVVFYLLCIALCRASLFCIYVCQASDFHLPWALMAISDIPASAALVAPPALNNLLLCGPKHCTIFFWNRLVFFAFESCILADASNSLITLFIAEYLQPESTNQLANSATVCSVMFIATDGERSGC
ncbi:hypothetical protein BC830DRAFT_400318 [Chytriomyces sp. MP71]|nr:hypothetical protein BC830DRAFT_400318 [Chytriomyces sp. MP71]